MLKIAFRNIFRNSRRTLLTMLTIVIGIGGLIFGYGYIEGMETLIKEETTRLTGDIKITSSDFKIKSKTFDTSSNVDIEEVEEKLKNIEGVENYKAKISFAGYVFYKDKDEAAIGFGVGENDYVSERVYEGESLNYSKEDEILVGRKLRDRLNLNIGDEVTILTATQYGSTYGLNYRVVGFYDIGPSLNKGFYISLENAMYLLDMEGSATEVMVNVADQNQIDEVKDKIVENFSEDDYLVQKWTEIGFASAIEIWNVAKIIIAIILGLLAGIGIFNTMMMAVFERRKEIGVMKAMGMEERKIFGMFITEGLLIGLMGSLGGLLLGGTVTYWISKKGIFIGQAIEKISTGINFGQRIYTKLTPGMLVLGLIVGTVLGVVATIIPTVKEIKKEAVENLRD